MDFLLKNAQWITAIGGILAIIGSILTSIQSDKVNERNLQLGESNNALAKKNAELTSELFNREISKNTFCYAGITFDEVNNETDAKFNFTVVGEYTLKDVSVRIIDLDAFSKGKMTKLLENERFYQLGVLRPKKIIWSDIRIHFDKSKDKNLKLIFSTNAGDFEQTLSMKYENNRWQETFRVTNITSGEVLGMHTE